MFKVNNKETENIIVFFNLCLGKTREPEKQVFHMFLTLTTRVVTSSIWSQLKYVKAFGSVC